MHRWKNWPSSRSGKMQRGQALGLAGAVLAGLAFVAPAVSPGTADRGPGTARVRRVNFRAMTVASGRVESAKSDEIRCALERLGSAAGPTILRMVDDGTDVKAGQVLAELDAADYKEMVRQQEITLQQVRAAYRQAELDLDVAKIGLESFRLGEMLSTDRLFRSQIFLAKSDLSRQADRLEWTRRMVVKGYASVLQVASDENTRLRATLTVAQSETAFRNYQKFTAPKTLRTLESNVNGTRSALDFQTIRLNREEERMTLYKKMVECCTIRAPHDGFALHANQPGRPVEIFLGATVRQRQRLFLLPDLSQMEVHALLHETVVNRVKVGMPVRVRLEALPALKLQGVVTSVSPLPLNARKQEQGSDVTYFLGKVKLRSSPPGVLRPGMTAELEIMTALRENVLAVPHTAVALDGGRHVCNLLHADRAEPGRVERRAVAVGESSHDLVEVTDGLAEGDVVSLDSSPSNPMMPRPTRADGAASGKWERPAGAPAPEGQTVAPRRSRRSG